MPAMPAHIVPRHHLSVVEIARGTVRLRVDRSAGSSIQPAALLTLPAEIENAVVEVAPDAEAILIDGLDQLYAASAVKAAKAQVHCGVQRCE